MKTGIELIAEERREQFEKHGFDLANDKYYENRQLIQAALMCINPDQFRWPEDWDFEYEQKILKKTRVDQLKVAGALIAAEIDRLNDTNKI